MYLNTIRPADGAKTPAKRVGRGIGSGKGKTCGRGHKGQRARAGGFHKLGFEGGQMPLQRRIPKSGFRSRKARTHQEIRLSDLNKLSDSIVDLNVLKSVGLITANIKTAKLILSTREFSRAITVRGLAVTKGARKAIVDAGGQVEA